MPSDTGLSLAEAVRRYADEFVPHCLASTAGPAPTGVASAVGAWMLLAVVADQAEDLQRAELEAALGVRAADAAAAVASLLDAQPDAVAAAVARWADVDRLLPSFADWTPPAAVERGEVPDQRGGDRWAAERTHGLIERFPLTLTPLTRIVLASALATSIRWRVPLEVDGDGRLRTSDLTALHAVVETDAAGQVAILAPHGPGGLEVATVVAAREVAPADVLRAGHEVAGHLAAADLPTIDVDTSGHAWTVTERREVRAGPPVQYEWTARLPAWAAESRHDLGTAPGFPPALASVLRYLRPDDLPADTEAVQSAVARYTVEGFEAAAVTAMGVRAGAAPSFGEVTVRSVHIEVDRPHAVVAVVSERRNPWHGLPVFSAWVDPRP